jgi:hypothetical protein
MIDATSKTGPCVACMKRAGCRRPCDLLTAILDEVAPQKQVRERSSRALMEGWAPFAATLPDFGDFIDEVDQEKEKQRELEAELELEAWISGIEAIEREVLVATMSKVRDADIARSLGTSVSTIRWIRVIGLSQLGNASMPMSVLKVGDLMTFPTSTVKVKAVPKCLAYVGKPCRQPGCDSNVSSAPPSREDLAPYCREHRRLRARARRDREPAPVEPIPPLPAPNHLGIQALFGTGELSASFAEISPELALALLERNARNRSIRQERIALYARDMAEGAWELNNQGLALGSDGQLYDGQHRLWSVVRSGRTVRMLVVRGLPPSARATIDQGRARNVGDLLRILDGQAQAGRALSWLRVIELLNGAARTMSVHVARERMVTYRNAVEWMLRVAPKSRPFGRASIVGAFV